MPVEVVSSTSSYSAPTSVQIPHFASPFRLTADGLDVVEQGSNDELVACVDTIARCREGFCIDEPEFGSPQLQFSNAPIDVHGLTSAINRWEPRAEVEISETVGNSPQERIVTVLVSGGS